MGKAGLSAALIFIILAGLMLGCAKERISTVSDEKGWHISFNNFTGVKEVMYPVNRGMKVKIVSRLNSGKLAVLLVLNGKNVFEKVLSSNETVEFTMPERGDCLVKVYARNAYGKFDFLI